MSRSNLQVSIEHPKVVVSATGLTLPDGLSITEWAKIGADLGRARTVLAWAVGDWWRFGEHRYGQRRAIVESEDWDGPSSQTCEDYAWVAGKFETSRRREVLSFGHHRDVASLPRVEADKLLDWAATISEKGRPRSIRDLREEIHRRGMKTASEALAEKLNFRMTEADLPRFVAAAAQAVLGPAADLLPKGGLELPSKPPELPGSDLLEELLGILARHRAEVAVIPLKERLRLIDRFAETLQVDAEIVLLGTTRFVQ
jgi:hypothetical protein